MRGVGTAARRVTLIPVGLIAQRTRALGCCKSVQLVGIGPVPTAWAMCVSVAAAELGDPTNLSPSAWPDGNTNVTSLPTSLAYAFGPAATGPAMPVVGRSQRGDHDVARPMAAALGVRTNDAAQASAETCTEALHPSATSATMLLAPGHYYLWQIQLEVSSSPPYFASPSWSDMNSPVGDGTWDCSQPTPFYVMNSLTQSLATHYLRRQLAPETRTTRRSKLYERLRRPQ